jgi:hypothetical protein
LHGGIIEGRLVELPFFLPEANGFSAREASA